MNVMRSCILNLYVFQFNFPFQFVLKCLCFKFPVIHWMLDSSEVKPLTYIATQGCAMLKAVLHIISSVELKSTVKPHLDFLYFSTVRCFYRESLNRFCSETIFANQFQRNLFRNSFSANEHNKDIGGCTFIIIATSDNTNCVWNCYEEESVFAINKILML